MKLILKRQTVNTLAGPIDELSIENSDGEPFALVEEAPDAFCPDCKGIGEVRRFVMYVGCITNGCGKCSGSGRVPVEEAPDAQEGRP